MIQETIDLEKCVEWVKNGSFKKICLQLPDHQMVEAAKISSHLRKHTDAFVYIIIDTAYEKCCTDQLVSHRVGADACIHFGHTCSSFPSDVATFHVFPKQELNVELFNKEFLKYFQDTTRRIILFYDESLAHVTQNIYKTLGTKYENLIVSTLNCESNAKFSEQPTSESQTTCLGRSYHLPEDHSLGTYDAFYLGTDTKTLQILSMSVPVNSWHYWNDSVLCEYEPSSLLRLKKRNFLLEKIKDANIFGIIMASSNVADSVKITRHLKNILKRVNKRTYLFCLGKINPVKLANFKEIDIFVNVSCPETSLRDSKDYLKPIVTPFDIELAFNSARTFTPLHVIEFQRLLPSGTDYKDFETDVETEVSLASGKIRELENDDIGAKNTSLSIKLPGTILKNQMNSDFLQSRTWNGLEQNLGKDEVTLAVEGRGGLPIGYVNESM